MKSKRSKMPKTYMGFPVDDDQDSGRKSRKKGIALIIAVLAVAMIMIFSSTMIINTQVGLELAISHRDRVKAEYMAKSAFNLATLILTADFGVDLMKASGKFGAKLPMSDGPSEFWTSMNGIPFGAETVEMMSSMVENFELSSVNDEGTIDLLKLFDGQFIMEITDEAGKINLSKCAVDGRCSDVVTMLERLFECPAEASFLADKNIVPKELAQRLKDWVDENKSSRGSGFGSEDDPYQKKSPPYSAKNSPMESVSELKLIEGWDDDIHAVFSPYITIFPFYRQKSDFTKLNINSASKELMGCLIPEAKGSCNDKFLQKYNSLAKEGTQLAEDSSGIKSVLSDAFCNDGDQSSGEWFTTYSPVFRIQVSGVVGQQEKKLTAVIQRVMPDKAKEITDPYKILYWRLM